MPFIFGKLKMTICDCERGANGLGLTIRECDCDERRDALEKEQRQEKWDKRFLNLAGYWAGICSKDPSTRVGAVIAQADMSIVSLGYNGFPKSVNDSEERYNDRETKYSFVCHSEANAILSAQGKITPDCSIYTTPLAPCKECAKLIIQAGIKRVVVPSDCKNDRWNETNDIAKTMFSEAGVCFVEVDL